jgi:ATP-binding cassette, subfamily C (CFTR/MRP), member 1
LTCSDFTWETAGKIDIEEPRDHTVPTGKGTAKSNDEVKKSERSLFSRLTKNTDKAGGEPTLPTIADDGGSLVKEAVEKPFELKNLNLKVPKGSFIAIVGRIGCGKVWAVAVSKLPNTKFLGVRALCSRH